MTIDEALDLGYLQNLRYATLHGQRIPVRSVPMEGYRVMADDDYLLKGMCSPEQCGKRATDSYLQDVSNVRHPYWRKYYTALGVSRLQCVG